MIRKFTVDRARAEQIATASETAFEAARQAGAECRDIAERISKIEATHRSRHAEAGGRYSPPPSEVETIARLRASLPAARAKEAKASEVAMALGGLASRVEEFTANPRRFLGRIEIARSY